MSDWADIDPLLAELRRRHWTIHLYGDPKRPDLFVAVHHWRSRRCADVVILRGHDRAVAYRTAVDGDSNVFAPQTVRWFTQLDNPGAAVWVLRRALTLDPPSDTAAIFRPPSLDTVPAHSWPSVVRPL
ncbi:hypothetical protein [Alloactinosynnema sp. L-07]|uniref:hypothetical protein n=1 Tax=Alloactinosynnema sp. L-07 TaxID=1653480 RepID=UPI00065EF603|nr:hypothetical protein [Alloactinosynnema sp. L-07]CRK58667.1 hypothetical protein [Alloactinosynnema sp. L-07]